MAQPQPSRIAVISDTHGLLRPEAIAAARGARLILHAGDVGGRAVLDALEAIAPCAAIRGNVDTDAWGSTLPATQSLDVDDVRIHLVHSLKELAIDPIEAGVSVVISGHSHRASVDVRDGVMYLNPGGAGPRRFNLPVTMAMLFVDRSRVEAEIVSLASP